MPPKKHKSKKISVYVLELSGERYYVGQSKNPSQRIKEHFAGKGSSWTRRHKPVGVLKIIETNTSSWRTALEAETLLTIELMKIYGWQNVRGGPYSASILANEPVPLSQKLPHLNDVPETSTPCNSNQNVPNQDTSLNTPNIGP